ncbi:hypothetical protein PsYK624_039210 [Phanerochaete sordida]|uniref:Uncharacterized protein n=1 Tax=Phanerochaete sordida TaxID=48140 RepID=A0A9P3LBA7_9APHY|nr:hypothetical protein PsYK624_039210 [Phanerochaete sordida]
MAEWMRSSRGSKSPTSVTTFFSCEQDEDLEDVGSPVLDIPLADFIISSADWAATTTCGDPFASKPFSSSDEPEISSTGTSSTTSTTDFEDEDDDDLWPEPMQRTPSSSSSVPSGIISPRAPAHTRHRSTSITSTTSRPAPARSILSTGSSMRTKRARAPPSVKFLDMPTIHYEDEDEDEGGASPGVPSPTSATSTKNRVLGFISWLTAVGKGKKKEEPPVPERPCISGPFPLWEAPPRRSDSTRRTASASDARSIRSVRSQSSLRSTRSFMSVRSCASRLQGYWHRFNGRDP